MMKDELKTPGKIIFFFLFTLILSQFSLIGNIEFGDTVKSISFLDIHNNQVQIPQIGKVTFLFFMDGTKDEHLKKAKELELMLSSLKNRKLEVSMFILTRTDEKTLIKKFEKYNFEFGVINDVDDLFFPEYEYTCGTCIRVVILDKSGVVRYYVSYIDKHFIKSIIERYASSNNK